MSVCSDQREGGNAQTVNKSFRQQCLPTQLVKNCTQTLSVAGDSTVDLNNQLQPLAETALTLLKQTKYLFSAQSLSFYTKTRTKQRLAILRSRPVQYRCAGGRKKL